MKAIGIALALICTGLSLAPTAVQAQATRTWVSGVGDDVNPCSRTAPCKTFPGTISKTAAGGEIDTLDPGSFAAVTITKAITIASEGSGEAGILVAGTNGITVNAGLGDVVILRGLEIDGGPIGSNSLAGIKFIAGKALIVQHCSIRNFTGGNPNGYGINFSPVGAGKLLVDDTTLVTNGQAGGTGGGIFVAPTGTAAVAVSIRNTQASNNNGFGIRVDASGSTGGTINLTVSDSETSGNDAAGIAAVSNSALGNAAVIVNIDHTTIANNSIGINGNGSPVIMRIGTSTITGNATGVKQVNSSTMTSYGTNQISDNPTPGFTLPVVGPL